MEDAEETFAALRSILERHADVLTVTRDEPEAYALEELTVRSFRRYEEEGLLP